MFSGVSSSSLSDVGQYRVTADMFSSPNCENSWEVARPSKSVLLSVSQVVIAGKLSRLEDEDMVTRLLMLVNFGWLGWLVSSGLLVG